MTTLFKLENIVCEPIGDGDAGIILKSDGSFRAFSTGFIDPNNLTEGQVDQATKLRALAVALNTPEILAVLIQMANDPNVVTFDSGPVN